MALAACLYYLFATARTHWASIDAASLNSGVFFALAAAAGIYALASVLLSVGWHCLTVRLGGQRIAFAASHRTYAVSSLAKYLPGNVAHLVGRHALARKQGLPHTVLGVAAAAEMFSLICAAGSIYAFSGKFQFGSQLMHGLCVAAAFACFGFMPVAVTRLWRGENRLCYVPVFKTTSLVFLLHIVYFLCSGAALLVLIRGMGDRAGIYVLQLISAYAVSWLAGFATPGAPAGLGVREAVMTAMLSPLMGGGPSLVVATLFRVATVCGDLLFFAGGVVTRFLSTGTDAAPATENNDGLSE